MTSTEKNHESDTVAHKVKAIPRAMADTHLGYAVANRLHIAKMAKCNISQTGVNASNSTAVPQPLKPPLECGTFDNLCLSQSVNFSSQSVN